MDNDFLKELIKKNWPMAVFLVIFWLVYQDFSNTNRTLIQEMINSSRATTEKVDRSIEKLSDTQIKLSEALNSLGSRQAAVEAKIDLLMKKEENNDKQK